MSVSKYFLFGIVPIEELLHMKSRGLFSWVLVDSDSQVVVSLLVKSIFKSECDRLRLILISCVSQG
jgi:hypothetical protein